MNRASFLSQPHVAAFVAWLTDRLPALPVRLRFPRSQYVPEPIDKRVVGIDAVVANYCWCSTWQDTRTGERVTSADWRTTRESLERLGAWLRDSVANGDEQAAGAAALEVLRWGGVRGAIAFIERKTRERALCAYLRTLAPIFALDGDHGLDALHPGNVERFDAGLTKVHALLDLTGSPIYDSRVGAALAMLYALFRQSEAFEVLGNDTLLRFPSGAARGAQIRNPAAFGLAASPQFYTAQVAPVDWARWQLRAGWIIRAVLERTNLFANEPVGAAATPIAARAHAMEAALFMIGYDLRSLVDASGALANTAAWPARGGSPVPGSTWVPSGHNLQVALSTYRQFRETSPADAGSASFRQWLEKRPEEGPFKRMRENFASYCFPLREREFALFDSTLEQTRLIEQGGEAGLYAANGGYRKFVAGDEREKVCLVCAGLTGICYRLKGTAQDRESWLIVRGHAGKEKSAQTLLNTGRAVGQHFGLLDDTYMPTELFTQFFRNTLDDLC